MRRHLDVLPGVVPALVLPVLFSLFSTAASAATPVVTFTASPGSTRLGAPATLSWSAQSAVSCSASGAWSGTKALSGTLVVNPMMTATYTLTCVGSQSETTVKNVTVTVDSGIAIVKMLGTNSHLYTDTRLNAIVWRVGWATFQPGSSTDAVTAQWETGIAEAAANGKKTILELSFAPTGPASSSDQGSDKTNIPQWAKSQGVRSVIRPGVTNEFPVWWDPAYLGLAKNAITKLTSVYNNDSRIAGYLVTGASGVLPPSLAGEQSDLLLAAFMAEGYVPASDDLSDVDYQLPSEGSAYGLAFREIMTHWAISTQKPLVYVSRPLDAGTLTSEIEVDPVGRYPHLVVVDNGFRQCDGQTGLQRFLDLQAGGHLVGWWGIAPNGFPTDPVASGIPCAAGALDMKRVFFCLDNTGWDDHAGTLDAAKKVFFPTDLTKPTTPLSPLGVARSEEQIDVSWLLSTDNVAVHGYKIFRDGKIVGNAFGSSYSDLDLDEAALYTYTVSAYDASGNKSPQSAPFTLRTLDVSAPSKPTMLEATAVSGSAIALSWIASTDNLAVTGYKIYRDGVQVGTSPTTTFSSTGLQEARQYTFHVAAYDAAGNTSLQSGSDTATTFDVTAPSKPAGLAASPISSQKITITWAPSSDNVAVDSYDVYRGTLLIGSPKFTTLTDSGLSEATSYTYTVKAKDEAGNVSAASAPITGTTLDVTKPAKPEGVAATPKSKSSIDLAWSPSSDNVGVTGYRVYRGGVQIATGVTGTTYSDSGLLEAKTYSYTVAAYDASGNVSPQSKSVSATTLDVTAPSKPANLEATVVSSTKITLTWNAATDNLKVAGYRIYRNGTQIATKTLTSYTDSGLAKNTTYTYTVAAYDDAGNLSAQSTAVTAKTFP
jgi:chitodextrinase